MTSSGMEARDLNAPMKTHAAVREKAKVQVKVSALDVLKESGTHPDLGMNLNHLEYIPKILLHGLVGMMMNLLPGWINLTGNLVVLGVLNGDIETILIALNAGVGVIGLNGLVDLNDQIGLNEQTDLYVKRGEVQIGQSVVNGLLIPITSKTKIESI